MKGLYVARLDLAQPHTLGVARKIMDQMAALGRAGLPAELLCVRDGAISLGGQIEQARGPLGRRLVHHLHFHRALREAGQQADYVYVRFQGAPPDFVAALRYLRRKRPEMPILVEFPSWPYSTERKGWRARLTGLLQDSGTRHLASCVDRIVTFSGREDILGIPTLRTDNGVAVEDIPVGAVPARDDPFRLVGVANLSFWHGYDRVIAGLAEYVQSGAGPRVTFDIAGTGAEYSRLRAQIEANGLQDTVRLLGPVHGKELDRLMAEAHVGISSIGMHRLDVDTSNIKSREFCARGLPFCIAYPDRDFPATLPSVYHLPAADDPVNISALVNWYNQLRFTDPAYPATLRAHAEAHLTWDAKMAPVTEWLSGRGVA
jgi:glycosyltransferase involved in cell wall biosynthesis